MELDVFLILPDRPVLVLIASVEDEHTAVPMAKAIIESLVLQAGSAAMEGLRVQYGSEIMEWRQGTLYRMERHLV